MKQTALITGASSGIGMVLSRLFARDGYDLILVARSEDKLRSLASELNQAHAATVTVLPADLSRPDAALTLYRKMQELGLQVDILVNNAGYGILGNLAEAKLDDSLGMIELNLTCLTVLTQFCLPGMLQRHTGRIMNVGSTGSFSPVPSMAVYAATKAYVLSFSEALAEESRGSGVTVTALCPGVTFTGFQARSGTQEARMVRAGGMTAEQVARIGYAGLMRGKRVVIPGFMNQIMIGAIRILPRGLVTRASKLMLGSVG
jgi:uncharacterized protein